jgi:hypothetical protein
MTDIPRHTLTDAEREALAQALWLVGGGDPDWGWANLTDENQDHHRAEVDTIAPAVESILADRAASTGGLHPCAGCGIELDGDDPSDRCEDCAPDRAASTDECDNEMCSLSLGHSGMHRPHGVPASTVQADDGLRERIEALAHDETCPREWDEPGCLCWQRDVLAILDTSPAPTEDHQQRADHYQYLYEQASEGKCGHSGLMLGACKASICDCFEFPWVQPAPEQHPLNDPTAQGDRGNEGAAG